MGKSKTNSNRDNKNKNELDKSGEATTSLRKPDDPEDYKGARKKLRHAVKAVVKANSETLAEKIVKKAQDGDVRGAEMMLSLIEKKKPGKEGKKKKTWDGTRLQELLVSEPEWDEEDERASEQVSELVS